MGCFQHLAFDLLHRVKLLTDGTEMWLTTVYGPSRNNDKSTFIDELNELRTIRTGAWLLLGDFNLIYTAEDKNND